MHRVRGYDRLVASYLGYVNDTVRIDDNRAELNFALEAEGVSLDEVVIEGNQSGNYVKHDGIVKNEMISFAGLCKMACCNLAESFENSASVTVGYSDAISGARQIKMLGLAGTYTQILDENRPIMQGLSAPYGLSYTPGMWLNSIQVSKGVASVTAGHEAITGQINLEHRKPTDAERLFVNVYLDDELRPEANITSAFPVSRDGKLTSIILLHGSGDTDVRRMDHNDDGFRDLPITSQFNVANKWLYAADNGTQIRWGWKFVQENRLGGMLGYRNTDAMRRAMEDDWSLWEQPDAAGKPLYGSHIRNRNANGYIKIGMPVGLRRAGAGRDALEPGLRGRLRPLRRGGLLRPEQLLGQPERALALAHVQPLLHLPLLHQCRRSGPPELLPRVAAQPHALDCRDVGR